MEDELTPLDNWFNKYQMTAQKGDHSTAVHELFAILQQEIAKAEAKLISLVSNPRGQTEFTITHRYICKVCKSIQSDLSLKEHKEDEAIEFDRQLARYEREGQS